jgi:hypothetical protein
MRITIEWYSALQLCVALQFLPEISGFATSKSMLECGLCVWSILSMMFDLRNTGHKASTYRLILILKDGVPLPRKGPSY